MCQEIYINVTSLTTDNDTYLVLSPFIAIVFNVLRILHFQNKTVTSGNEKTMVVNVIINAVCFVIE